MIDEVFYTRLHVLNMSMTERGKASLLEVFLIHLILILILILVSQI